MEFITIDTQSNPVVLLACFAVAANKTVKKKVAKCFSQRECQSAK